MRIFVIQPHLEPFGGGAGVCAWMLQALKDHHQVTFFCWRAPDFDTVNRFYGTSIRPSEIAVREVLPFLPRPAVSPRLARLLLHWILLALARRARADLRISVEEENDLGGRGIQYVHIPRHGGLRDRGPLVRAYHRLIARLTGTSVERMRNNITVVNSDWTADLFHRAHGLSALTIHPPAPGSFAEVPWERREDAVLSVGRMADEKRFFEVIEVVRELRRRGYPLRLHLVLSGPMTTYGRRLLAAAARDSWIDVHRDIPRAALDELMSRARYGLQGMIEEHYGMAVAEMVRAGVLVFIPRGGGQTEIIDEPRLQWSSASEAVAKMSAVLDDAALRATLDERLRARREHLAPERFVMDVRRLVAGLPKPPANHQPPGYDSARAAG